MISIYTFQKTYIAGKYSSNKQKISRKEIFGYMQNTLLFYRNLYRHTRTHSRSYHDLFEQFSFDTSRFVLNNRFE